MYLAVADHTLASGLAPAASPIESSFVPTATSPVAAASVPPTIRPEIACPSWGQLRSHSLTPNSSSSLGWPTAKAASAVAPSPEASATTPSHTGSLTGPPATGNRQRLTTKAVSLDHNSHSRKLLPPFDPFDTDWAAIPARESEEVSGSRSTNPFAQATPALIKTFEVQM